MSELTAFELVAPFLQDADNMIPYLETRPREGLRTYLVASERDAYCLGIARGLAELLPQYGVDCHLEVYGNLDHSFPLPFEDDLPRALSWLMKE